MFSELFSSSVLAAIVILNTAGATIRTICYQFYFLCKMLYRGACLSANPIAKYIKVKHVL